MRTAPASGEVEFARAVSELAGDRCGLLQLVAQHPRSALRTARWVASLPTLRMELPGGAAAEAMLRPLRRRAVGIPTGRLARAVLTLAPDGSTSRGRTRQALRTNVARARRHGVSATERSLGDLLDDVTDMLHQRHLTSEVLTGPVAPEVAAATSVFVAVQAERAVAYDVVLVCGTWAWLREAHSELSETGSAARWLVHLHMVDGLLARGVQHLVVDSAVALTDGQRHFQQLTGFVATNVALPGHRAALQTSEAAAAARSPA